MASSDDDQLNKNAFLFISVRENRNVKEKIEKITKYLEEGADINAVDRNNSNNSPIHIAVRRSESRVVRLLIEHGANPNAKNSKGETPLAIAQELNTDDKQEIVNLLQIAGRLANTEPVEEIQNNFFQNNAQQEIPKNVLQSNAQPEYKYLKRTGTSGVCGQLYETKLLSLVLMRALNDEDIEQFHLGTNIRGIGDLDDICLRYQLKGHEKPTMVFVQAKHREDREKGRLTVEDVRSATGDFSLRKYFESFLTIKERFRPNNKDIMFDGDFSSVECNFIIYTPAKDCFAKKQTENKISEKVHYLINTGQETKVFQYEHDEEDIDFLTKMTVIERFKKLGSVFLELIMAEKDKPEMILVDKLIARYHVVMGREVLQLPKLQPESKEHRIWKFRPDFFESDCDYLDALRKTFYKELSTKRCDYSKIVNEDRDNFKLILEDPCASTISKLIGKLAKYNDKTKKLELIEVTDFKKKFKPSQFEPLVERFNKIETNDNVIREAIRIKLESMELKLPFAFGNLDMTFRGSEIKIKRRMKVVADKLINLCLLHRDTQIVEINDQIVGQGKTIEQGIIDINGGIGSAVGNLLVLDTKTKMLKFDMENEALPSNADLFLKELKDERYKPINEELSRYRINININGFPKDSFNGDEYDQRQARDFLSKLWFYANQAKEDEVESILKYDINKYYNKENGQNKFKFKIHSDAIFLRSHDEIQKWWMQTGEAPYLNRASQFFEQAKLAVIDNPLLTVLNFMYTLKIQNIGIKFNQNAVHALELGKITERLYNVITEASVFSGIKIMQYFEHQDKYSFIDFDYVLSLPLNDYNTMLQELQQTNIETLIIIYEKLKYYEGLCNKLKEVMKIFNGSTVVVVTDVILAEEIKEYVGDKYRSVRDDKTYLTDLNESSQTKILEESTIVFQGEELPLKSVSYQNARSLVRTEILCKLIHRDKIEIGHTLYDQIYKNVNHFIDRSLSEGDDTYKVDTLNDINNEVVVVTGRLGMGKSALLTHLSLKTKLVDPLPWIVRVNLPEYEKEFTRWQEQDITINVPLVLHFLCTIACKNIDTKMEIKLDHYNGQVIVSHVHEDINPLALFELELFLYLYNYGKVIFLFDDFNAMCPHYEKEVIKLLKLLKEEGKRMWIMTCPYRHTKTALVNEFGNPYKLNPLHADEKKVYLDRFFRTNLKLERLNYDQFENIRSFMKFMQKFTNRRLVGEPERELVPLFSLTFHLVYVLAVKFFQSEINRASAATIREKVRENFQIDLDQYTPVDEMLGRTPDDEELELSGTPLHLYIAANYFKFRIEDSISFLLGDQEARDKWDLILNSFTLYQHFIEAHVKRIFQKEDADDESVVSTFQRAKQEFLEKHKKLGLFTICRHNDLTKLLKPDEINEIQDTISKIKTGKDRTSLVSCVVNEVPRFAHLVFAEYFAIECLTDMMKQVAADNEQNPLKNASLWQSILNILLFNAPPGVRKAFDYKLQSDNDLAKLAQSEVCRKVVLELLLKQDKRVREVQDDERMPRSTPVADAFEDGLTNIVNLFLSSAQLNLNRGNVDEFLGLLNRSVEKFAEFGKEYADTIKNVFDSVKDMDVGKLGDILQSGRLTEVPLRHANNYCSSETASELQRHVEASTSQLPVLIQNIQQVFQQKENIRQTLTTLSTLGVKYVLNDIVERLKPPDPELD